jgi:GEVED domain/Dockerin type I domain
MIFDYFRLPSLSRSKRNRPRFKRCLSVQTLENRRVLATVLVTTLNDVTNPGDGVISLREAIAQVNPLAEDSIIQFAPTLFPGAKQTLSLSQGAFRIQSDHSIEVIGPGSDQLVLDAQSNSRVMQFSGNGDLRLVGVELTNGFAAGQSESGGGLKFDSPGTLTLEDVRVFNNRTSGPESGGGGVAVIGGGIANIIDSEISNNQTLNTESPGGGIFATAHLVIRNTYIALNRTNATDSDGGGVFASDPDANRIHQLNSVSFFSNQSRNDGGGAYLGSSAQIDNVTATGQDADDRGGAFYLTGDGDFSIRSSTIVGGVANVGGGIFIHTDPTNVVFQNSIIALNTGTTSGPDVTGGVGAVVNNTIVPGMQFTLLGNASGTGLTPSSTPDANSNRIGSAATPIDPMLRTFAFYGGTIRTLRPQLNSVVIDAGSNALATGGSDPIVNDGRGQPFARIFNTIDLGAFEEQPMVTPVITWTKPENILVGTALSSAQLNATVNANGTLTYNPSNTSGTVLGLGNHTLRVSFFPADTDFVNVANASTTLTVVEPADYGDAPSSYLTRHEQNGASHKQSTLRLGESIAYEADANPNRLPNATTDADDDGVSFLTSLVASSTTITRATISVEASANGLLDAWVDFNRNGTFDTNEKLIAAAGIPVVAGDNRITFEIPSGATPGQTFARFRLSTTGGLGPSGQANDGEVEDYSVTLLDGSVPTDQTIDVPGNLITVIRDSNDLVVRRRGVEVYRSPFASIDRLSILTDAFSGVLELNTTNGDVVPVGGIRYDGRGQIDTLRTVGPLASIDLTAGSIWDLISVEAIDIGDAAATTVRFDAATLDAIDTNDDGLILTGQSNDQFVITDRPNWRSGDPTLIGDELFAKLETTGSFFQTNINAGNGWQNILEPNDIDNDGLVTPLDALVVMNGIRRGRYFDRATGDLVSIDQADPFPGEYYDQDGDNKITPLDALKVFNTIRRRGSGESQNSRPAAPIDSIRPIKKIRPSEEQGGV